MDILKEVQAAAQWIMADDTMEKQRILDKAYTRIFQI